MRKELEEVLEEAARKVRERPDYLMSPEVRSDLEKLEKERQWPPQYPQPQGGYPAQGQFPAQGWPQAQEEKTGKSDNKEATWAELPILLVWELVPDETRCYYFTDLMPEETAIVLSCHNHFVNGCDNTEEVEDALKWLNEHLDKPEGIAARIDDSEPITLRADCNVVVSGLII